MILADKNKRSEILQMSLYNVMIVQIVNIGTHLHLTIYIHYSTKLNGADHSNESTCIILRCSNT